MQHTKGEHMSQAAGWYTDPTGRYSYRYWDGLRWTGQVNTGGNTLTDPNPLDAEMAQTPPAPGTMAPELPAPSAQPATPPSVQVTQGGGGMSASSIVLAIVAAVAVVALLFVLFTNNDDDDGDTPTTTTEQTEDTEPPDTEPPADSDSESSE
jgi:hypothetical protein